VTGSNGPVTGSVTFSDGAIALGTVPVDSSGTAALTATLPIGVHTVTATYSGSADYQASAASATVSVARYATTAVLAASSTSVKHGKPVTLTVRLSGGSTPTGTVTFYSGSQSIGSASAAAGTASLTWTPQAKGSFSISAAYAGDGAHQPAASNAVIVKVT
jgi:hypothetical protein